MYDRINCLAAELRSVEGGHERIVVVSHAWPLDALTSVLGGCRPLERMRFFATTVRLPWSPSGRASAGYNTLTLYLTATASVHYSFY